LDIASVRMMLKIRLKQPELCLMSVATTVGNMRCMLVESVYDEAIFGIGYVRGVVSRNFYLFLLRNSVKSK
jgi:hypothetical protein